MSLSNISHSVSLEYVGHKQESKELTLYEKFTYIVKHISVEPIIFFYILPGTMGYLATQNLNLEKACRVNLAYNTSICDAMINRNHSGYANYQEEEVQNLVAKMITVKTAIMGFFPTCLLLFFGSWSDRHNRRKPVILMPIFGDITSYLCLFVCAHFFLQLSVEYSTIADSVPFSLGGGTPCIVLGVFSYVSDLSSDKDRTIRIGALSMFQNTAIAIGNALGGAFIKPLGYKGVYIISCVVMTLVFIYGYFVIRDRKIDNEERVKKPFLEDFFDLGHIKNTFKLCFKDIDRRRRKMIVMLLLSVMLIGPFNGELAVVYLYTRIKFGWNEVDYSIYNTLQFVTQMCGSIFALSVFSKYFNLSDASLGLLAMISKVLASLVYAFAPSGTYFLVGVLTEVFHGTAHIALRSIISKMVPPQELGQVSSVFGVTEAMMPLAFGPLYTTVYNYTMVKFPGAFYLISAGLYSVAFILFGYFYTTNMGNTVQLSIAENEKQQKKSLLEIKWKNSQSSEEIKKDLTHNLI